MIILRNCLNDYHAVLKQAAIDLQLQANLKFSTNAMEIINSHELVSIYSRAVQQILVH